MIISNNVFYMHRLNVIGGTESFLYYIARKFKDKDVLIVYDLGDITQVNRMREYAPCIKFEGQRIICKRVFFNYGYSIIDSVNAEEYYQVIHTDYLHQNIAFVPHPKITHYIAPTEIAAKHFTMKFKLPCEVIYNPIEIDKPKKVLRLISATRLTLEKGKDRMVKFIKLLDSHEIPFLWEIYTDDKNEITHPNVIYMKPRLDIANYIAAADYLVQLSNQGEGYGYTVAESLILKTPVIVTPVDSFIEIGVRNNENGFIVPFNMRDIDIKLIYKSRLKFKYTPPETKWKDIIKEKGDYTPTHYLYRCKKVYEDMKIGKMIKPGELIECTEERAKYLKSKGVII